MTQRATRRLAVALGLLAVVCAALGVWVYVEQPLANRVDVGEQTPQALDTLSLEGRRVTASLTGTVQRIDEDGVAYVGTSRAAFPVRGDASDSLSRGDRVLAVGRVSQGLNGRWLSAEALGVVRFEVPPGERRSGERPTVQPED